MVEAGGNKEFYLRPIAYSESDADGIFSNKHTICLDIYCVPAPSLHANSTKGIKVAVSDIVRSYPEFIMQAKTPGNYHMISRIKAKLNQLKVDDIFLVDKNGYVVEATVANLYLFKGDVALTPPNNGSILPGITRKTIAEILMNPSLMFSRYKKVPLEIGRAHV